MAKQIEMNYKLESGYEVIYPNVILNSVTDWASSIYSKSEIDDKVSEINQSISDAQMNPGGWENLGTFNGGTGSGTYSFAPGAIETITPSINYKYWLVVNFSGWFQGEMVHETNPMRLSYNISLNSNPSGASITLDNMNSYSYSASARAEFNCRYILCLYPVSKTNSLMGVSGFSLVGVKDSQSNYYLNIGTTIRFNSQVSGPYPVTSCGISVNNITFYRSKINNLP